MKRVLNKISACCLIALIGCCWSNAFAQTGGQTVTGTVTAMDTGETLPGVNVIVKNTTNGTVTDVNGTYRLSVSSGDVILVFSSIGYVTQEVAVSDRSEININMAEDVQNLEEVVIVGYGTQKKENLTGSVAAISGKDIADRPLPNVGAVLAGMSPNLNIGLSGGMAGEPGASRSFNIRGLGSITGNDDPLILVDGVQMDINNLDPQNIESISVLKDASAAAVYGARAPFGVILITTKKGTKGEGVQIQYNNNINIGTKLGIPHMENSLDYAAAFNQAAANAGGAPVYSDEQIERMEGWLNGTYPYEYDPAKPPSTIWEGRRTGNASHDWPHIYLKKYKVDVKHNVNISGGTDKTQYYVSMGLFDEGGFYSVGYDEYKRYDILANLNSEVNDWLSFGLSTKYAKSKTDFPEGITTVDRTYFFGNSMYLFAPNQPYHNIDGGLANPIMANIKDAGRIVDEEDDFVVTLRGELEPLKGWKTSASYSYNLTTSTNEANPKPVPIKLGSGDIGNVGKPGAAFISTFWQTPYTVFNALTSYEKTLGNHFVKLLGGYEQEERTYKYLYARADDLITSEVPSISTALGATTVDDIRWDWATQGVFGRLNYNFKEKYLFEFSARYNGSSRFAPDARWGFFPSASAGYTLSREAFWAPLEDYVNTFKVRASYGSLGNQTVGSTTLASQGANAYLYIPSVPIYNETPWIIGNQRPPYATTPGLISAGLTWETITTLNLGVDATFLRDRLELTFDWFDRKTSDMIGPAETLPYALGTSTPRANNAELQTRGFELMLKWRDRLSNNFSYHAQIAVGDAKSTILKYRNENGLINTWYEGKENGEIWGFVSDGLIQTDGEAMPDQSAIHPNWRAGDMKYQDLNGDGKITRGVQTLNDHGDLVVIGNSSPRYNVTAIGGFNWKGFDFYMHWAGIGKRDYSPHLENAFFWGLVTAWGNSALVEGSDWKDYWRPEGETGRFGPNTDAYFPKPYFSSETIKNKQVQSRYVLDAAYLRLKNLQIGYTIPAEISSKVFVKQARIFISGSNLLTITKFPKSMDPETTPVSYAVGAVYPISRSYSAGVNITF